MQMSRLHFPYLLYFYATVVYGTEISLLSGMLCLGIVGGGVLRPSSLLRIVVYCPFVPARYATHCCTSTREDTDFLMRRGGGVRPSEGETAEMTAEE